MRSYRFKIKKVMKSEKLAIIKAVQEHYFALCGEVPFRAWMFSLAARNKGYKPEDCIVIGDSLNDFAAANSAGMKSIAFVGAEGNDTAEYRKKCVDAGVIAVCSTMQEVKQTINVLAENIPDSY